jgi:hypothetical protein
MLTRARIGSFAQMHQEAWIVFQVAKEFVLVLGDEIRDARHCIGQDTVETLFDIPHDSSVIPL